MREPRKPLLVVLKSRLSRDVRAKRELEAREREMTMQALAAKIDGEGPSFNAAVREVLPGANRSWAVRCRRQWKRRGLDGLLDCREPPNNHVSQACEDLVIGARLANPRLKVSEALKVLQDGCGEVPAARAARAAWRRIQDRPPVARHRSAGL